MTLFANLPPPTVSLIGTEQTTTDHGLCYCNGSAWIIIGFPQAGTGSINLSSPGNTINISGSGSSVITEDIGSQFSGALRVLGGLYTYATLPSAASNPNVYAATSDVGAVYSNGASWLQLYNQTVSSLAIANNPPLIAGSNGTAYSLQLSATGGTPPYTWIKVSQFADTNTWTVSSTGVLACASPATSALDNITVQVTDNTGAPYQKLLTVTIAASAGTPAAAPTFSPAAGTYTSTQTVTISDVSAGTTIYYTTNGSTPTTSSPVYSGPITVSTSQTISAIASGGSFTQSPIGSASYIINAAAASLGFPVSGVWATGGNQANYASPAFLTTACKYNRVFLGWYLGTDQNLAANFPGMNMPKVMSTLKTNASAAGNTSCKTFLYNIENEWFQTTGDSGFVDNARLGLLNANPYWWLSSNYPGTTHVTSQDGLPKGAINITNTSPSYNISTVGGLTGPGTVNWMQAAGWLEIQQQVLGNASVANVKDPATAANSFLDGVIHDNQEQSPYVSGCFLNTSTVYSGSAGTNNAALNAPCAAGYAQLIAYQRALQPNLLHLGNCDNFGYGLSAVYSSASLGLYDYPMLEFPFGRFEHNQGNNFNNLLTTFVNFEALLNVQSGNYVVGQIEGPNANASTGTPNYWTAAQSTFAASDWQAWRYQAAVFTMMRWIVCPPSPAPTPVYWFDELDGAGKLGVNWMGAPTGARNLTKIPGSPGTYGLFQADFANGSVIINPFGNGSQTINMPYAGNYLGYNGFGDPTVNTGAAFTTSSTHTFADRDAIFIQRSSGGGGGGGTTQTILQFLSSDVQTSATSTSQAMAPVTAGSTILALTLTNFGSVSSVTDTQGNSYGIVQTASSTTGPGNQKFYVYAAYNVVGGANTVTVTYGAASTVRPILLLEVSGSAAAPLDGSQHNDQTSPGTGAGAVTTGTAVSNTKQPALAIAFSMPLFSNSVPAAVAPYTSKGTFWSASTTGQCEFLALTATASQQGTFTATAGTTEHLSLLVVLDHV